MRMGGQAKIWRDSKLTGNDIFADEIVKQFPTTAVLVSVLSPRYLNSDWCTREVSEFCECAQKNGGLIVDNKSRVFKVIKTPVDTEETLPPVIQGVLGYEFFTFEDGTPLELDSAYGEKFAQDYNRKVGKLAWDIVQVLKKLEADTSDRKNEQDEQPKPIVYLAECSYDRREDREKIDAELKTYGYTVMPDQQLPRQEEEDYVTAVKRALECCTFSIHLIGDNYGAVPDGPSEKSLVVLQNEIAMQQSKSGALRRVIWLPEGASSTQASQQAFIDTLHSDSEAQFGAELITGDLEELKTSIRGALKKLEEPESHVQPNHNGLVYLICGEKDRKATVPVRKFFKSHGMEVSIPVFEGSARKGAQGQPRTVSHL